jgi:hypothetical protein
MLFIINLTKLNLSPINTHRYLSFIHSWMEGVLRLVRGVYRSTSTGAAKQLPAVCNQCNKQKPWLFDDHMTRGPARARKTTSSPVTSVCAKTREN